MTRQEIAMVGIRNTRGERVETEVMVNEYYGSMKFTAKFWIPLTGGTYNRWGIRAKNGNWVWFDLTAQTFAAAPLRERMWRMKKRGLLDPQSNHSFTVTATLPTATYDALDGIEVDLAHTPRNNSYEV